MAKVKSQSITKQKTYGSLQYRQTLNIRSLLYLAINMSSNMKSSTWLISHQFRVLYATPEWLNANCERVIKHNNEIRYIL